MFAPLHVRELLREHGQTYRCTHFSDTTSWKPGDESFPWGTTPGYAQGHPRGPPDAGMFYGGASTIMAVAAGGGHQQLFQGTPEYKVEDCIGIRLGMNPDAIPVFREVVRGQEMSCRTGAGMFSHKFTTVLFRFEERKWYPAVDTWDNTLDIWTSMSDSHTPKRVDIPSSIVSNELSTQTMMSLEDLVQVPTLSGQVVTLAISETTATQWLRLLLGECSRHGAARVRAHDYLDFMTKSAGESRMTVATRFCLATRAATPDPDRCHTSEMSLFWRFVTTEQQSTVCRHVMTILIATATEQSFMRSHMV